MEFTTFSTEEAAGTILAHGIRAGGTLYKKGRVLSPEDVAALRSAGIASVIAARLSTDDVSEDEAAQRIASRTARGAVRVGAAFTGRANIYANEAGVLVLDTALVEQLNALHESITVATLPNYARVAPRQMLATVKIIPFAAPRSAVEAAERLLAKPLLKLASFAARTVALIATTLPSTKPAILAKTRVALDDRLMPLGSSIQSEERVAHETSAVAEAIRRALAHKADLILIMGASAITDRRDVIPAAIEQAGGEIERFGMPVDPGNLLLLANHQGTRVIGLPGCARSPKLNGFDFVLWRLAAGLPVTPADMAAMGVGGLLSEIPTRPQPRDEKPSAVPRAPSVAGIVLAAGLSSRMGRNKLVARLGEKALVRHVAEAAVESALSPIVVVTGNEAAKVAHELDGLPVKIVHNPDYSKGLSASLKKGLTAIPEDCDAAMVLLGDMPTVDAGLIDKLIAAFDPSEDRTICVATRRGKRGNPVLWARRFFPEMATVEGDVGAKHLMGTYPELVCEVEAASDAPLIDIDTPDALEAIARGTPL